MQSAVSADSPTVPVQQCRSGSLQAVILPEKNRKDGRIERIIRERVQASEADDRPGEVAGHGHMRCLPGRGTGPHFLLFSLFSKRFSHLDPF